MSESTEKLSGPIGTILGWASISYAFGFFTVLVHTAKLDLPVIDMIEPIYVWVGLPIAAVTFFWRQIFGLVRIEFSEIKSDIEANITRRSVDLTPPEVQAVSLILAMIKATPTVGTLFAKLAQPFVERVISKEAQDLKSKSPDQYDRYKRNIHRMRFVSSVFALLGRVYRLAYYGATIGLAFFLYVWAVYPAVPLSLGGGKPAEAQLVIEREAVPPALLAQNDPQEHTGSGESPVILDAKVLYLTKEYLYIESPGPIRASIQADKVLAVIWKPLHPSATSPLRVSGGEK
jgi:protein-S-isoprenylcysteine O-methyltransferase Ste14